MMNSTISNAITLSTMEALTHAANNTGSHLGCTIVPINGDERYMVSACNAPHLHAGKMVLFSFFGFRSAFLPFSSK